MTAVETHFGGGRYRRSERRTPAFLAAFFRPKTFTGPATETALPPPVIASRAERVRMAFRQHPMSEREEKVILAVMRHPGSSSKELSAICGWQGTMWHTHLGALCKKRRSILSPVEPVEDIEEHFLCGILTEYNIDRCTFRLRPDVEPVLREMGVGP